MATSKVLNTPELLELILLQASLVDIFVTQRVNKAFSSTIQGSVELQRRMFLALPRAKEPVKKSKQHKSFTEAAAAYDAHWAHTRYSTFKNIDPELAALNLRFPHCPHRGVLGKVLPASDLRIELAPLHLGVVDRSGGLPFLEFHLAAGGDEKSILGWQGRTDMHATGSWRKMVLGVWKSEIVVEIHSGSKIERRNISAGGNLGDLFDLLEEVIEFFNGSG